jgi:hypothetical protein
MLRFPECFRALFDREDKIMKFAQVLASGAAMSLAAAAMANVPASYTGNGGALPNTGGGGTWATVFPASATFSVTVANDVKAVSSIDFTNLAHTWIGDLQIVLSNPDGDRYNVHVRPGSIGNAVGWSDNYLGNYSFAAGGAAIPGGVGSANNIASGTYAWGFNNGIWANGTLGVQNANPGDISGSAGVWTVTFYDWAGGDTGNLGSFTLNVLEVPAPGAVALLGAAGLVGLRRRR